MALNNAVFCEKMVCVVYYLNMPIDTAQLQKCNHLIAAFTVLLQCVAVDESVQIVVHRALFEL